MSVTWKWVENNPYASALVMNGLERKTAELERENAALRHSEENLASTVRGLEFELEKAQKEVYALRADKRRLDWLNKTKLWKPDIRTVIDAARAKETKP